MCDNDRKSVIDKYWSSDIQCWSGYGECDFINHACVCHDGYTHDLSYIRQRSCQVPKLYFPIAYGIQLICSLLLLPYVFLKYREATSIARMSLQLNLGACAFYILHCLLNFSYSFINNPFIMFVFYITLSLLSTTRYVEIYSFMYPLTTAALRPVTSIKRMLFSLASFFKVLEFIPLLIAAIVNTGANDINNDIIWSTYVMIFALIIGVEAVSIALYFLFYSKRLLQVIETIPCRDINVESYGRIPRCYLQKIRLVVLRIGFILPVVAFMLFFAPLAYLVTGFLPGSYLFTSLTAFTTPALILASSIYASNSKRTSSDPRSSPLKTSFQKLEEYSVPNRYQLKHALNLQTAELPSSAQT